MGQLQSALAVLRQQSSPFGAVTPAPAAVPLDRDLSLIEFYRRVRPPGPGWRAIRSEAGVLDSDATTSTELAAAQLGWARVVKAFNTIYYVHLAEQGDTALPLEDRRAFFVAGDDEAAKALVARLIEEIGFAAVDTGSLSVGGRRQQRALLSGQPPSVPPTSMSMSR